MHKRILSVFMSLMLGMSAFSVGVKAEETDLLEETVLTEEAESSEEVSDEQSGESEEQVSENTEEIPVNTVLLEEAAEEGIPEETEPELEWVYDEWINPDYIGTIESRGLDETPRMRASGMVTAADAPSYSTIEDASAYIREQMKARNETISFTYTFPSGYDRELAKSIWKSAYTHTGVPDEGDYLRWQNSGYQMGGSGYGNQWTLNFTTSYYTTAAQEAQVDSRTESVINSLGLNGKTDEQKIRLVHDYVVNNVTYDRDHLGNEDYKLQYTAYAALINGTAVCQGYSLLTYRLMLMAGIDCRIITGEADNGEQKEGHAWNIVKLDGYYYFIDTTWDDGTHSDDYYLKTSFDDHFIDEAEYPASFFEEYPIAAIVDSGECGYDVYWKLFSSGELRIYGTGNMYSYNRSSNAAPWQAYRDQITSVSIGEDVTNIGNYAFYSCTSLSGITIPDHVTSIGEGAFYSCTNLSEITLSSGLTGIGYYAFYGCTSLTGITIPEGAAAIGNSAFRGCTSLVSITIPASVTSIGNYAFDGCGSLQTVDYQSCIGDWNTITIETGNDSLTNAYISYTGNTFSGWQWSDDCSAANAVFTCNQHSGTEEYLPASIKVTSEGTDDRIVYTHTATATLNGETYTDIAYSGICGENLNWRLSGTGELLIHGTGDMSSYNRSGTNIAPWSAYRDSIVSVRIGDGVTGIGSNAFYECSALQSVSMPDTVTSIEGYAFVHCTALTGIDLSENITNISGYTFYECTSLASIDIPEGVTSIGKYAFYNCGSLTSLDIPDSVTNIVDYAFMNCSSLTSISIPDGVTTISYGSLWGCTSLTSIDIPESVTSIGESAFSGCNSLRTVVLPSTVTSIGNFAFKDCSSLTDIVIPERITSIGTSVFTGCDSLTHVTIPERVTSIGANAFYSCDSLASVTILGNVKTIGKNAFAYCGLLRDINIPASVTSIGESAFLNCASLTSVVIPEGVTTIEKASFRGLSSLTSISIPGSVTSIGTESFLECNSLQSIDLPSGLTSIGLRAFHSCTSLEDITIPETVTSIDSAAFYNCISLQNVVYGSCIDDWNSMEIGSNNTYLLDADIVYTGNTVGDWHWSEDHNSAAVDIVCAAHNKVEKTIDASVTAETIKSASCEETGEAIYTGTIEFNGEEYTDTQTVTTPALGHDWSEWTVITAPTCTEAGEEQRICATDPSHTETRTIESTGHSWGNWTVTVQPTCTEAGTETRICANDSSHIETRSVKALGHSLVKTEAVEATCETAGNTAYWTCSTCGKYFSDEAGQNEIQADSWIVPAKGHAWGNWTVTVQPTCTEAGEETRICANDGNHKETRPVEALGHDYQFGEWIWADDYSTASLKLVCANNSAHTVTVDAQITVSETEPGYKDYTAAAEYNGTVYTDTKRKEVPVIGTTSVTAVNDSVSGKPSITWETVSLAEKYEVYRSAEAEGEYTMLIETAGTSYLDTDAEAGTKYFYKVRCVGTDGKAGEYSEPVSITAIPSQPTGITTKNNPATGNIKVSWDEMEDAYKYQVYRATSSNGTYTRIATTENTYYVDTTGESGKTYYYKVRSVTENNVYSKYSSKKSAKCSETVLTLTAKVDTASGSPVLSWNTAEEIKYYQLYRSENDGVTYTKLLNTTNTSRTDSTAEAGKTYLYKVRAIDTDSKSGSYSEPVSIEAIPSQPTGIATKNNPATGNIRVSWDDMEDAYKYQVYRATSSNGTYTRIATTENTYYVDTTGESGQTYYYKVRSVTENSVYSKFSSKKSAKCSETVMTITAKTDTATGKPKLTWNTAEEIRYYQLYRSESEDGTYTKLGNMTVTDKVDSTAETGKTYWYKVRVIDTNSKSGSYSEPVSIVCKPGKVTGLKATVVSSTSKPKLTWTAVEDAAKYQVYYSTSKTGTYKKLKEVTGTSYTHTGAETGTVYYYKVRAVSENGTYGTFSTIAGSSTK